MLQLSQNIKLIRGLAGKTQPEFAKIIGENLSNLKTYENTSTKPKLHVQKRIAEIAGVTVKDLREKDLSEKDIKLKDEKDEKNATTSTETPQNGQENQPDTELTQVGLIVRQIQNATNPRLSIEQIAKQTGVSRPHLTKILKKGRTKEDSEEIIVALKEKFAKELSITDTLTTTTSTPKFGANSNGQKDLTIIQAEALKDNAATLKSQQELISDLAKNVMHLSGKLIEKK